MDTGEAAAAAAAMPRRRLFVFEGILNLLNRELYLSSNRPHSSHTTSSPWALPAPSFTDQWLSSFPSYTLLYTECTTELSSRVHIVFSRRSRHCITSLFRLLVVLMTLYLLPQSRSILLSRSLAIRISIRWLPTQLCPHYSQLFALGACHARLFAC